MKRYIVKIEISGYLEFEVYAANEDTAEELARIKPFDDDSVVDAEINYGNATTEE